MFPPLLILMNDHTDSPHSNRRLDNKLNIFEGMFKNYFFLGINTLMIGGQILIIFIGSTAFSVVPIDVTQWAICIIVAAFSLPAAVLIRYIPDEFVGACWDRSVIFFTPIVNRFNSAWRAILRRQKKTDKPIDEENGKSPAIEMA